MNKQIPTVILALACTVLAVALYLSRQENAALRQEITSLISLSEQMAAADSIPAETAPVEIEALAGSLPEKEAASAVDASSSSEEESAGRRMMSSMAKMMENPTMNKVMEASQRGAIGALYSDLIEYLDLDAEETEYFMDLLMYRQMKQMDLGMKMMAGDITEEEKTTIADELEEADETVKAEMEKFLNNAEDYGEFQFYEKTMGERMMLSSMDQKLAGTDEALSDETYRAVLDMMHEAKKNYAFSSDLHDEKNTDLSPERFSKENLESFASDMDALNELIIKQAQTILTPDQLKALEEAIRSTAEMQKAQLEMAAQMFGGGKKATAP